MTDSFFRLPRTSEIPLEGDERFVDATDPAGGRGEGLARRRFIVRAGSCLSALLAPGVAASLGGCTLPVRSYEARDDAIVEIPRSRFPELRRPGGLIKVRHRSRLAVYVRCVEEDRYEALSGVCTHQGCVVDPVGEEFRCPCHGSTFDRAGSRTSGPAREPLEHFGVSLSGDSVILDLSKGLNDE